jgi:hypothetical protein
MPHSAWWVGLLQLVPLLRVAIAAHTQTFRLRENDGLLLSNTRWLQGRDNFTLAGPMDSVDRQDSDPPRTTAAIVGVIMAIQSAHGDGL